MPCTDTGSYGADSCGGRKSDTGRIQAALRNGGKTCWMDPCCQKNGLLILGCAEMPFSRVMKI